MPQDGPKIVPRALLAALGRSWTALGPSSGDLGASGSDPGGLLERSWSDLARLGTPWGLWGRSWRDLGRSWGHLNSQDRLTSPRGRRLAFAGWHPLETFCRKFLPSRDLENLLFFRDLRLSPSTRRAALGAADLERPAGGDRRPLRKGSSACSMCEAGVV